jgi:hypothetical protein
MTHSTYEIVRNEVAEFPALLSYLELRFAKSCCNLSELLIIKAEDSPYPLQQWLEALVLFEQWLTTRRLSLPIENQISYVACSAEAGSAYATLTQLPDQVIDMLDHYGCDEAELIQ